MTSTTILTKTFQYNSKFLLPLALLYLTIFLASTSVAYKMIQFGTFIQPGSPYIFPLTYILIDIIAEVYGRRAATMVVIYTLVVQLLFALLVYFVINLPSPEAFTYQPVYDYVFGNVIYFVLAGTLGVLLSKLVNIYFLTKWKVLMRGRHFWLRSIMSTVIGSFVLTLIIILFAYLGTLATNVARPLTLFYSIYLLEVMYAIVLAWPAWLITAILKYSEKIDAYG